MFVKIVLLYNLKYHHHHHQCLNLNIFIRRKSDAENYRLTLFDYTYLIYLS